MYPLSSQKAYPFGVDIANVHPSVNSRVRVMVRKNKNSVSRQGAGNIQAAEQEDTQRIVFDFYEP